MGIYQVGGKIRALFQNQEYAFIDLVKRQQIVHRVGLAKWLQSYAATHEPGRHRISVENLKKWCGYNSPTRKFREALVEALGELETVRNPYFSEILQGRFDGAMAQVR